ncbi:DUF3800 domain-containing protein [Legionella bozemanae]|uniref:DUF3800 domain-containing protein n=1 Tax=Legionella bozemanae TaxID=447 RepID=UPI001041397C|nr:DUF3800 domain-containing protein [Legionella bozemanae]
MELKFNNPIIYIDESGNTEEGYIDINQPFITFGSHCCSEENCKKAITKYFPRSQCKEIKYSRLRKMHRLERCVELYEYLNSINEMQKCKVYTVYKPIFLFHSFLTFAHDRAYEEINPDWTYKRYQELWFHYIKLAGADFMKKLIFLYYQFIKSKSKVASDNLFLHISFAANLGCKISGFINDWYIHTSFEDLINPINNHSASWLDTTLPCIYQLLNHWNNYFNGKRFTVIHDNSFRLKKERQFWN